MVYQGYLAIGGEDGVDATELLNAQRAFAYARHIIPALPLDMPPENLAPDLPALLGHGEYSSPLADMAPWVDPDDPASTEFLGLFPTEMHGFDDSTWHSDTVEFLGDGGVALGGRNEGREIRVKALMLASTEAGLQAGKTWLRNILTDAACRDAGIECGGEALITLASPPRACPELIGPVEPGQVHPCLAPFVRQYYRVTCTEGFEVRRQWWTDCGPLIEVEFLLYAGVPQPHLLPEFIGQAQSDALATYTNLITNPSFEASTDGAAAGPYVDIAQDDQWAASGDYSLQVTPKQQSPRVRRNFVLNPSFETDLSGWSSISGEDAAQWTNARVDDDAFSGTHSLRATVTDGGPGVAWLVDLADMSSTQRSAALYLKASLTNADAARVQMIFFDEEGNAVTNRSAVYSLSGAAWTRVALAGQQADVTAVRLGVGVAPVADGTPVPVVPGDTVTVDAALAEASTLAGAYFDGDSPDEPGVTYTWDTIDGGSVATYSGAVISTRTYADLTDAQDLAYGMEPDSSYHLQAVLHMEEAQGQTQIGDARTLQVVWTNYNGSEQVVRSAPAPNAAGDWPLSLDFTVPDNVSKGVVRLYAGGDTTTWWDAVLLSEEAPPHYFDGSTPDADGWAYDWTGTANNSTSTAEYNPIPPETVGDVQCDPDDVTVVLRRNLAPNPLPGNPTGWIPWSEKGNFTRSFVADDTLRAGGQSARVVRGSGSASVYCAYLRYVGYADVPSRPRVVAGERYTVSMYVKLDRTGKARMAVNVWNSSRNEIAEYRSTIPDLTQNGWARLSLTFTAPQGAASLGVHAWTYVTSSTNAPTGATSWFSQVLVERAASVGTYFDGNFTDTSELDYSWEGQPNHSSSIISQADTGDLLVDPDCEYVPPPPRPPAVVTDCIETPEEWTRYTVLVTNDHVPRWGSAVPVITLSTGDEVARQVRIRFYPLDDPNDPLGYAECDYEIEFILTYLPPSTTMVIDGVRRQATASVGGNDPVSALHLLTGSGGAPYTWGTLTCDRDYAMTVDIAPVAEDVVVSLDLVGRE